MVFLRWRFRSKRQLTVCLLAALAAACNSLYGVSCGGGVEKPADGPASQPAAPQSRTDDERPKIVVLGDSLTAGLGLLETQSYPHLLQEKIDRDGFQYEVVNAGVSGDTSAGGLRRLDWALQENVRVLIVALGGNDGLRGLSVSEMKQNLGQIIETARSKNVVVILAGMEAPPNYGPEYADVVPAGVSRSRAAVSRAFHAVSPRQGRRPAGAQSGRRHPSQSRGSGNRGGHGLERAQADTGPDLRLMIELHGVSKSVPSGAAR